MSRWTATPKLDRTDMDVLYAAQADLFDALALLDLLVDLIPEKLIDLGIDDDRLMSDGDRLLRMAQLAAEKLRSGLRTIGQVA